MKASISALRKRTLLPSLMEVNPRSVTAIGMVYYPGYADAHGVMAADLMVF
jgi:hypothetical protein